jgi:glycosyltransferase involved in cell wall biosynthesis
MWRSSGEFVLKNGPIVRFGLHGRQGSICGWLQKSIVRISIITKRRSNRCSGRMPEPFGLVMIEAMACGTPVIAYGHGSVPEIIEDGVTGFIVNSEEEAVAALQRIDNLSRPRIRAEFERRFTARRMAENYLETYESLMVPKSERLRLVG